jgi:hypothetical protein
VGRTIWRLVASLAIAATLVSIGLAQASAAEQVPFSGHFSGSLSFPDPSHIQLTGEGNASQLGHSTNNSSVTALPTTPPCDGGFNILSVETLTAANGDQLSWTVVDAACPIADNVFQISATFTVTGGTGRFAGATGGGTIECVGDFANGTFDFTVTGAISRPNGG